MLQLCSFIEKMGSFYFFGKGYNEDSLIALLNKILLVYIIELLNSPQ